MSRIRIILLIQMLVLNASADLHAQERLVVNKFKQLASNTFDFSENYISSITQDRLGFIWFSSGNGVFRYDGVEFKNVADVNKKLDNKGLLSIYADSDDRLWLGSWKVFYILDLKNYNVTTFNLSNIESDPRILGFEETADGVIVFTSDQLFIYHNKNDQLSKLGIDGSQIYRYQSIQKDSHGHIWLGTSTGLLKTKLHGNELEVLRSFLHSSEESSICHDNIKSLYIDSKNSLWIGTTNGLDLLDDIGSDQFKHYSYPNDHAIAHPIRSLAEDLRGRIWIGTTDGIVVVDRSGDYDIIKHVHGQSNSLSDEKVMDIFTDRGGTVWVGTYYGGVNYWDEQNLNFRHINDNFDQNLTYNVITSFVETRSGLLYVGTEGGGISIWNSDLETFSRMPKMNTRFPLDIIKCLSLSENTLWIGSWDNGLVSFDLNTEKYVQYIYDPTNERGPRNDRIISLASSKDKIWFGCLEGRLGLLDVKTKSFTYFENDPDDPSSIPRWGVRSLKLDRQGNLWVGTLTGLAVIKKSSIDDKSFKFTHVMNGFQSERALIADIHQDYTGTIWVGTETKGLFKIEDFEPKHLPLPNINKVYTIACDSTGVLWLSTNKGIAAYEADEDTLNLYDQSNGLKTNQFYHGASLLASNKKLYVGGSSGITIVDIAKLKAQKNSPEYKAGIKLTGFSLFNKSIEAGDSSKILTNTIEYTSHISLNHDQNIFTIKYAQPNYAGTVASTYEYRLLGLDDKWVKTKNTSVSYTLQKAGDYTFEVRIAGKGTYLDKDITSLEIGLKAPLWLSNWAITIYILLVAAVVMGTFQFISSRSRLRRQLKQEELDNKRLQEEQEQKLRFFTNISHDFRTPLTLISGGLEQTLVEFQGSSKLYRKLQMVNRNVAQLFKLINELMDFRKLENRQMSLTVTENDFIAYLKEIYLSFKPKAKTNHISYTFLPGVSTLHLWFDRDKMERVFYNLLSNAFKYTPDQGSITIEVAIPESSEDQILRYVEIRVKDSGVGIPAESKERVFEQFYEVKENINKYNTGTGIGLTIVKSIVELHHGYVTVTSEPGKGSTFTVYLPIGKSHFRDTTIEPITNQDLAPLSKEIGNDQVETFELDDILTKNNKKYKILIAEDNPDVGNFLKEILEGHFEVSLQENGLKALQYARANQPDLIISDVMMPKMDGMEFCTQIKSNIETSHIPFIMLTARTSLLYKYDGLESGADEYLNKPFHVKELLLKCNNILTTRENLRASFNLDNESMYPETTKTSMDEELYLKAIAVINKNISNELFGVAQFCEELNVGRGVLLYKIKAWTGMTPSELMLNARMKHAAKLVEKGTYRVSEISSQVGFKNQYYFSKCFKQFHGMSPREYARRFQ